VYTQFGKPHRATYDFAQRMLERHLKEVRGVDPVDGMDVYMVGDNPESDIAGANLTGGRLFYFGPAFTRGASPGTNPP